MADWASMGHGMRRRAGVPSNHHEQAGDDMGRQHYTSEEHHEMASKQSSSRIPMGNEAFALNGGQTDELDANQFAGNLVPRNNVQSADPAAQPVGVRQNIERIGATYRVTASTSGLMDPTLGPTQASGRIVPSVRGRNTVDFGSAEQSSYL